MEHIIRSLGKPYYESKNCLIYNVETVAAMRSIGRPFACLSVTSPPYNIGKEYEQLLALEEYVSWCRDWIEAVYNVTMPHGAFWLNLGYQAFPGRAKAIPIPYLLWQYVPFFLMQEIVWNYGAGVAGRKFYSPRNEKFLWYVKSEDDYIFNLDAVRDPNVKYPNQKKNGKVKVNPLGKNPSDVWCFPKVTSGSDRSSTERTPHPAQFPEAVIERIILASSNAGDVVFDPFLGSGTTAAVATRLGRSVIGFEINTSYCDIAADRIERVRPPSAEAKQLELLNVTT